MKKSSILDNPVAHQYYREHSSSYQVMHGRKRRSSHKRGASAQLPHIDPNRDEQRVHSRYLQYTKAELVERLLHIEQFYAQSQQQLTQLQFALLEAQQKEEKEPTISGQ